MMKQRKPFLVLPDESAIKPRKLREMEGLPLHEVMIYFLLTGQ